MKTAVTVWEDRISPVFDSARMLLIAEIENAKVTNRRYERFNPDIPSRLLNTLTELGVEVLICGAISEVPATIIEAGGIKLIPFIAGYADEVLACYAAGKQNIPEFLMPGCGRKRCRQGKEGNVRKGQKKEVSIMPKGDGTGSQGQGQGSVKGRGGCKTGKGPRGSGQCQGGGSGGKGTGGGQGKGGGQGQGKGK